MRGRAVASLLATCFASFAHAQSSTPPRDALVVRAALVEAYGHCQAAARGPSVEAGLAACMAAQGIVAELDAALARYPASPAVEAWKTFAAQTRLALDTAVSALQRTGQGQTIAAHVPGVLDIGGARMRVMVVPPRPLPVNIVTFDAEKAALAPTQFEVLSEFSAYLRAEPSLRVRVEGHADDPGDVAHNRALSLERATLVMRALVAQGVPPDTLEVVAHGRDVPRASGTDAATRAGNRRVELWPVQETAPATGAENSLPALPSLP